MKYGTLGARMMGRQAEGDFSSPNEGGIENKEIVLSVKN